jgi:opacity protein-like surface antigen
LLDGRLVPYLIGGVGYGFVEFNDRKPRGADLAITNKGSSGSYAATLGAGIEYFVTRHIAAGIESKYSYSPGHSLQINHGPEQDGTLQGVVVTAGLRVYLFEFGR